MSPDPALAALRASIDHKPNPADPVPALRKLIDALDAALTAARAGDVAAYTTARDAARAIEVAGRRTDVGLRDEQYTAQRDWVSDHPRGTL